MGVYLNLPTLTYHASPPPSPHTPSKQVHIIVSPGNPGSVKFYELLVDYLADSVGLEVWGWGYEGHNENQVNLNQVRERGAKRRLERSDT